MYSFNLNFDPVPTMHKVASLSYPEDAATAQDKGGSISVLKIRKSWSLLEMMETILIC